MAIIKTMAWLDRRRQCAPADSKGESVFFSRFFFVSPPFLRFPLRLTLCRIVEKGGNPVGYSVVVVVVVVFVVVFFIYFISSFGGPLASCSCPSASPCFFLAFFSSCSSPASSRNGMNGWRMGGGLKNEIKKKHTRTHTHTQQTRNEGSAATWGPAGEWTKRRMKRWRKEKRKSVKRKKTKSHTQKGSNERRQEGRKWRMNGRVVSRAACADAGWIFSSATRRSAAIGVSRNLRCRKQTQLTSVTTQ